MLYNVRIITQSGMLMYEKIWTAVAENMDAFSTMISGLLTAISTTSQSSVGMTIRYIAVSHVGISVAIHNKTGITCYVFHEEKDGEEFGHFICESILKDFISLNRLDDDESKKLNDFQMLQDMKMFSSFNATISNAIRKASNSVLQEFRSITGVLYAEVVEHDKNRSATESNTQGGFEMIANLETTILLADRVMSLKSGGASQLIVVDYTTNRMVMKKVGSGCLVVVAQKNIDIDKLQSYIKRYSNLLEAIHKLFCSLQSNTTFV